jgi:pimeloyl-ACP methyl ester carboxylesterase
VFLLLFALLGGLTAVKATPIVRDSIQEIEAPNLPKPRSASREAFLNPHHVYVLHSGLGDDSNWGAKLLQKHLLAHGISEDRIIILPTPFPKLEGLDRKTDWQMFKRIVRSIAQANDDPNERAYRDSFRRNITIYEQTANPHSNIVKKQRAQLHQELAKRGLSNAPVTWVGYSAGGAVGLGVAALNTEDPTYRIQRVITLGSPVLENHVPENVEVVSVVSRQDRFFRSVLTWDTLAGLNLNVFPPKLDSNDHVLIIPNGDHSDLVEQADALEAIIRVLPGPTKSPNT